MVQVYSKNKKQPWQKEACRAEASGQLQMLPLSLPLDCYVFPADLQPCMNMSALVKL